MDPISQGLLGSTVVQAVFPKSLNGKAWIVGFLAGIAPDADIVIRSKTNPLLFIEYHRHFTHALSFIPVGSLLVGALLLLLVKELRAQWRTVFVACLLAYATHGLLDASTAYGTVLYWPFSNMRVAWDMISIVDPIFTGCLFLGVFFGVRQGSSRPARIALVVVMCYMGFGLWQHNRALQRQISWAKSQGIEREAGRVVPHLGQLFSWHSVYRSKDKIYMDTIKAPLYTRSYIIEGSSITRFKQAQLPDNVKKSPTLMRDFKIFNWFVDGYLGVLQQQPLVLGDMRYISSYNPITSLWGIAFPYDTNHKHVKWLRNVRIKDKS